MPAKQYRVSLTQDEREHLLDLTRRGPPQADRCVE
jgi:hypothetical protein